jgi:hypothetical protein
LEVREPPLETYTSFRWEVMRQMLDRGPMIVPTAKRKSRFLEAAILLIVHHKPPPKTSKKG